jgi:hypothetical protein
MQSTVAVRGLDGAGLRELRTWLVGEPELRSRVRLVEEPIAAGELGGLVTELAIVLTPGGVATVLVSALISYLRNRTTDVTITITTSSGSRAEVSGRRVRRASAAELQAIVTELTDRLS